MFYADAVGLEAVLAKIRSFEASFGSGLWAPALLLTELAHSGRTFSASREGD
jgi:hypothetical protein